MIYWQRLEVAASMPPYYVRGITRAGYSLELLTQANLGVRKSGTGELAPVLWQQGKYQKVINYCLRDVKLTFRLYNLHQKGLLYDPNNGSPLNSDFSEPRYQVKGFIRVLAYLCGARVKQKAETAWFTKAGANHYELFSQCLYP